MILELIWVWGGEVAGRLVTRYSSLLVWACNTNFRHRQTGWQTEVSSWCWLCEREYFDISPSTVGPIYTLQLVFFFFFLFLHSFNSKRITSFIAFCPQIVMPFDWHICDIFDWIKTWPILLMAWGGGKCCWVTRIAREWCEFFAK